MNEQTIPTSELLYGAADIIERDGWLQRNLGAPGGPRCAIGALMGAAGQESVGIVPGYGPLFDYIGRTSVAHWNNAPERTADEVIATLRAAALIEAAKENPSAVVTSERESVTA